jgi:hypothetical protein
MRSSNNTHLLVISARIFDKISITRMHLFDAWDFIRSDFCKIFVKIALSFCFLIYCLCCIYMMINCGRINYFAGTCFLLVESVLVMLFLLLSPHGSDALLLRLGCSLSLTRFYFLVP